MAAATRKPSGVRDVRTINGWVFFPTSFLGNLTPGANGSTYQPIRGDYWEANAENWPGSCNVFSGFDNSTLTSWQFVAIRLWRFEWRAGQKHGHHHFDAWFPEHRPVCQQR